MKKIRATDPDRLLTIAEAAAIIRIHPITLRKSDCPRMKIGARVLFERPAVLAWARTKYTVKPAGAA